MCDAFDRRSINQCIGVFMGALDRWLEKEGRKKHALRDRRRDPSPILGTELFFFFFLKLIGKVVIKKREGTTRKEEDTVPTSPP